MLNTPHFNGHLDDWFKRLKSDIDLHDLADKLGLKRQGQRGNHLPARTIPIKMPHYLSLPTVAAGRITPLRQKAPALIW